MVTLDLLRCTRATDGHIDSTSILLGITPNQPDHMTCNLTEQLKKLNFDFFPVLPLGRLQIVLVFSSNRLRFRVERGGKEFAPSLASHSLDGKDFSCLLLPFCSTNAP